MDNKKLLEELRGIRRVVINECYGGFGLSDEALERYRQLTGTPDSVFLYNNVERDDPYLVQLVREMGDAANGPCSELKIVEIPADVVWDIEEYDGVEWIAERHRTWS